MTIIFHYASISVFEKIIDSKTLWLTSVLLMKDEQEIHYLYNDIVPVVNKLILELPDYSKETLENVVQNLINNEPVHNLQMPYCACCSKDGDLVFQWNDYGDQGKGVSLGFDTEHFQFFPNLPHPHVLVEKSLGSGEVNYDIEYQRENIFELYKYFLNTQTGSLIWLSIQKGLTCFAPIYKDPLYFPEQEVRFIYFYENQHNLQLRNYKLSGPYSYKNQDNGRFDLKWYKTPTDHGLKKIFLGPNCPLSISDMSDLLIKHKVLLEKNSIVNSSL